ncbi:MAG: type leader peptidase family protein [Candidatus Eremiobacteraeota bacterium]|jgi:prepilin peptidase CpaA|nr:type leader peptidase family protein [Candidatus Eremiobacteraeota bacterium]
MTPFVPILAAAALAAAASDVRARRIPNALTGALAVAGVAVAGATGGLQGAAVAVAILAFLLAVGTYAFSRRWFGGGDIKLLAAGCCGLSPALAVDFLIYTALCGGLLSLYALATSQRMVAFVITRQLPQTGERLPYAVAAAGGALFLWVALLCPAFLLVR